MSLLGVVAALTSGGGGGGGGGEGGRTAPVLMVVACLGHRAAQVGGEEREEEMTGGGVRGRVKGENARFRPAGPLGGSPLGPFTSPSHAPHVRTRGCHPPLPLVPMRACPLPPLPPPLGARCRHPGAGAHVSAHAHVTLPDADEERGGERGAAVRGEVGGGSTRGGQYTPVRA